MKWISTKDLRSWADSRVCQQVLPQLVRKLIRASIGSPLKIQFPSGENVQLGGWDGILLSEVSNEFVPLGTSVWEFGTDKDPKGKADKDYDKRSKNPIGVIPANTTYVFVTPRLWQNGAQWSIDKNAEKIWKKVKVINAGIFEEWLETNPTVAEWLATEHLGMPNTGIQPTNSFWEKWITGPGIRLKDDIILAGRDLEVSALIERIGIPGVLPIKSDSVEESLAFILGTFKSNLLLEEDFFARSLIVSDPTIFRQLSALHTPLILIPMFEDDGSFHYTVDKGHTVIVPLGQESGNGWSNEIKLPILRREAFVRSLIASGLPEKTAEQYSKDSARNITILRRRLEFVRNRPKWSKAENIRELIPALLVQRWNSDTQKDKILLAKLSGQTYDEYEKKLYKWLNVTDAPLIKIGNDWRLISAIDAWIQASSLITQGEFDALKDAFLEVFREIDPILLDDDKPQPLFRTHVDRTFSYAIRKGLAQSLILISINAQQLNFSLPICGDLWVDNIIRELLNSTDINLWKSMDRMLPLLAEASPEAFISAVESKLNMENSPIAALFNEKPGPFNPTSYHTGLLWALEGLAWEKNFFPRTVLILAKLSEIDPGGHTTNRPINSLREIFKSWHPQTFATLPERLKVLQLICRRSTKVGWEILLGMLPNGREIAHGIVKMNWRNNSRILQPITRQELGETYHAIAKLILDFFDFSEEHLHTLIEQSVRMDENDRNEILDFISANILKVERKTTKVWDSLRQILSHHRSVPDARWALQEDSLLPYQDLYNKLTPADIIEKNRWLLDTSWPQFPEGLDKVDKSHEDIQKIITQRKIETLHLLLKETSIENIIELSKEIKDQRNFGFHLADATKEVDDEKILDLINNSESVINFLLGFISRKTFTNGVEWVFHQYKKLESKGFNIQNLITLFLPIEQSPAVWEFIEKQGLNELYWQKIDPFMWSLNQDEKIYFIEKILEFKRTDIALNLVSHFQEELPTSLILKSLDAYALSDNSAPYSVRNYEIQRLFEDLDKRDNIDEETMVRLEWAYLQILTDYGSSRGTKLLHKALSSDPVFFNEALKLGYRSRDEKIMEEENRELSDDQLRFRGTNAWHLFHSWKIIPGMDEDGKINKKNLNEWVDQVRDLADNTGRKKVADMLIGQILAKYPESESNWPPQEICEIIERVNTSSIVENFGSQIFNNHGSYSKSYFEGGRRERGLEQHYSTLADELNLDYPVVARILRNLAIGYSADAVAEDINAKREELDY